MPARDGEGGTGATQFPKGDANSRNSHSSGGDKARVEIRLPYPSQVPSLAKKRKKKKNSTTDQQRNKENFKTLGRNIYMYIVMCISTWLHQGGGGNRKEGRVVIHKGVSIIIIIILFIIITPFLPSPSAVYGSFGTCETELQHFSMQCFFFLFLSLACLLISFYFDFFMYAARGGNRHSYVRIIGIPTELFEHFQIGCLLVTNSKLIMVISCNNDREKL